MDRFASYDGTQLAYRTLGTGRPLLCLPGGPGRSVNYFGDLGGLAAGRQLILLDLRGTGESADADPATYRCDRMVADVDALRAHLGLDRIDLLGHSAAGNLALLYAAAHPDRLDHLVLLTPGLQAVGLEMTDEQWEASIRRRSGEPWYAAARAAVEKAEAGDDSLETRLGYMPFLYGRWDEAAQAHAVIGVSERAAAMRVAYYGEGAFGPDATRTALGSLAAAVLIYVGDVDAGPTPDLAGQAAGLFTKSETMIQPGGGHFPWLDDPAAFTSAVSAFLG